jgi:hypothetical protein
MLGLERQGGQGGQQDEQEDRGQGTRRDGHARNSGWAGTWGDEDRKV